MSVFVICAWLNTESLLLLFQQQPCVARLVVFELQLTISKFSFIVTILQVYWYLCEHLYIRIAGMKNKTSMSSNIYKKISYANNNCVNATFSCSQ